MIRAFLIKTVSATRSVVRTGWQFTKGITFQLIRLAGGAILALLSYQAFFSELKLPDAAVISLYANSAFDVVATERPVILEILYQANIGLTVVRLRDLPNNDALQITSVETSFKTKSKTTAHYKDSTTVEMVTYADFIRPTWGGFVFDLKLEVQLADARRAATFPVHASLEVPATWSLSYSSPAAIATGPKRPGLATQRIPPSRGYRFDPIHVGPSTRIMAEFTEPERAKQREFQLIIWGALFGAGLTLIIESIISIIAVIGRKIAPASSP